MAKPKWTPIKVRLGEIRAWSDNPRLSTKAQALRIIDSEKKFGQPVPFLLMPKADSKYPLIDGHQRLAAWLTVYGSDYAMDAMVSDRALTEDEHKEMIITLHTGATGSWDWNALSSWDAGELQDWGMNTDALKDWNNDANNLKEMLTAEVESVDAEPQIDRAEELLEKWQVKTGYLWRIGEHRLICGDCTDAATVERLMGGEKADLVFTDPPYNIDYQGVRDKRDKIENDKMSDEDFVLFLSKSLMVCETMYVCCSWQYSHLFREAMSNIGCAPKAMIVWDKVNPARHLDLYYKQHELIYYYGKLGGQKTVRGDVWTLKRQKNTFHPTTKPTELVEMALGDHEESVIVYDGFAGSGATMVASQNLSRRCYAAEIAPKYCSVVLQRMSDAFPELVIERIE